MLLNLDKSGIAALQRNIESHPQILTGDANVDTVVKDIFTRIKASDPKVMKWDDNFKKIVGLYDQLTKGDIPKDKECGDPWQGWGAKARLSVKLASGQADSVIDECRRAEHSKQKGKSKKVAMAEFKKAAAKLYKENNEPLPRAKPPQPPAPPPAPAPVVAPAVMQPPQLPPEVSSGETQVEDTSPSDLSPPAAQPATPPPLRAQLPPLVQLPNAETLEVEQVPPPPPPVQQEDATTPGLEYGESWAVSTPNDCALCAEASASYGVFDKEWWTPDRKLAIATFTGLGIAIGATATLFYQKFFRRTPKEKKRVQKRSHARSWDAISA